MAYHRGQRVFYRPTPSDTPAPAEVRARRRRRRRRANSPLSRATAVSFPIDRSDATPPPSAIFRRSDAPLAAVPLVGRSSPAVLLLLLLLLLLLALTRPPSRRRALVHLRAIPSPR
jgi:hypothetical protein